MTFDSSETTPKVSIQLFKKSNKKKTAASTSAVDASLTDSFQLSPEPPTSSNERQLVRGNDDSTPLVIPAIENASRWKRQHQQVQGEGNGGGHDDNDEDRIAAKALIEEAAHGSEDKHASGTNVLIPLNERENEQYKADLQALPDAPALESYERIPISDFGAALLRGMGWTGDTNASKADEDSLQQLPRPVRLGLGATPAAPPIAPTSTTANHHGGRPKRPDQFQREALLKQQQESFALERQKQLAMDRQRTMQNGSLVLLLESGQRARILQLVGVPGLNMVKIQREGDKEPSVIKRRAIERLLTREELEETPFAEISLVESARADTGAANLSTDVDADVKKAERKSKRKPDEEEEQRIVSKQDRSSKRTKQDRPTWVVPNIRVRVITEKLGRKYFKEKGVVVDVTPKGATIRMHDGKVIDRVPERYIQTALPKTGGNAIILAGRHKLVKGQLLERDSQKETGVVQVYEDMSVVTLSLDDLAEWCGPLDDDLA